MELVGSCQPEADHTMSDVLIRPSEVDISEPNPSPEPRFSSVRDKVSIRRVAIVLFALVVGGWLFIADTAADNDVIGGFGSLISGFANLPALVFNPDAYQSWWEWMSNAEGWSAIFERVVEHVQLVAMSMSIAIVISVVLGVVVHRVHALRGTIIGFASLMLTVPSLALFAIFISIPAIGVGDRGPIIALVMYSILPIVRNTVTGLEDVDRAVIESAKGMGLNKTQRLLRVELPLAWPIILTGIRVATLLNIGIAAIAPLVGGTGLGRYIGDGLQRFPDVTSVERMWTGVVLTIVLALIADLFFSLVRRFTTSKGIRS
jgi:osmoprotectant transport system permease protein